MSFTESRFLVYYSNRFSGCTNIPFRSIEEEKFCPNNDYRLLSLILDGPKDTKGKHVTDNSTVFRRRGDVPSPGLAIINKVQEDLLECFGNIYFLLARRGHNRDPAHWCCLLRKRNEVGLSLYLSLLLRLLL